MNLMSRILRKKGRCSFPENENHAIFPQSGQKAHFTRSKEEAGEGGTFF
jgi:hypothetical protein